MPNEEEGSTSTRLFISMLWQSQLHLNAKLRIERNGTHSRNLSCDSCYNSVNMKWATCLAVQCEGFQPAVLSIPMFAQHICILQNGQQLVLFSGRGNAGKFSQPTLDAFDPIDQICTYLKKRGVGTSEVEREIESQPSQSREGSMGQVFFCQFNFWRRKEVGAGASKSWCQSCRKWPRSWFATSTMNSCLWQCWYHALEAPASLGVC